MYKIILRLEKVYVFLREFFLKENVRFFKKLVF